MEITATGNKLSYNLFQLVFNFFLVEPMLTAYVISVSLITDK